MTPTSHLTADSPQRMSPSTSMTISCCRTPAAEAMPSPNQTPSPFSEPLSPASDSSVIAGRVVLQSGHFGAEESTDGPLMSPAVTTIAERREATPEPPESPEGAILGLQGGCG